MVTVKNSFLVVAVLAVLVAGGVFWYKKNSPSRMPAVLVINVLDKELFDDCHIQNSVHVSIDMLDAFIRTTAKNAPIVVYCSNYLCSTSDYVAKKLRLAGFTDVSVYAAGMTEWFLRGLPVEGACKATYLGKKIEAPADLKNREGIMTTEKLLEKMGVGR